jgi:hypothetical protein
MVETEETVLDRKVEQVSPQMPNMINNSGVRLSAAVSQADSEGSGRHHPPLNAKLGVVAAFMSAGAALDLPVDQPLRTFSGTKLEEIPLDCALPT